MLGCFQSCLGQIWKNPTVGLNMWLNQWLGLSIFDPNIGGNNPAFIRVYLSLYMKMLPFPFQE